MKRMLFSLVVLALVAFAIAPAEAQACGGRFRSRVRAVVTAPVRLFKAVRAHHCDCGPACQCAASCPAR